MSKHYLWGLALVPFLLWGMVMVAQREQTVSEPIGLACYVNVAPTGNPADTVWVCFRPRP